MHCKLGWRRARSGSGVRSGALDKIFSKFYWQMSVHRRRRRQSKIIFNILAFVRHRRRCWVVTGYGTATPGKIEVKTLGGSGAGPGVGDAGGR